MKKITMLLALLVLMIATIIVTSCSNNIPATTTTATETTTTAPGTNGNTTTSIITTTAPGTTTVPATTTTTVPETTEYIEPVIMVPNLYYNDELQSDVVLFNAWGTFILTDDNTLVSEVVPAIGELTGIEFTKGTIQVDMIMSESAGAHPLWDSGVCFAISDPFDPESPYYWETHASYYFALVHDYRGFGISRVGFDHGNGPIAWDWMPNSEGQIMTDGPFWTTDGGEKVTVKIETDGETYIKGFVNGDYVAYFSIPEGGNLFTSGGTINKKVAIRAEGRGQIFTKIEIFQED